MLLLLEAYPGATLASTRMLAHDLHLQEGAVLLEYGAELFLGTDGGHLANEELRAQVDVVIGVGHNSSGTHRDGGGRRGRGVGRREVRDVLGSTGGVGETRGREVLRRMGTAARGVG